MHNLIYQVDDSLPRMAWCARLDRGAREVHIHCGSWVERRPDAFFEGAWSGPFDRTGFDTALTSCATGGKLLPDGILFCTPTHTTQALYSFGGSDSLWVSNSLIFLLQASRTSLRDSYPYYECDLMSVMFGLDDYREYIPTEKKGPIRVHYHRNLVALDGVRLETRPRPLPDPFDSYRQYSTFLDSEVSALMRNAADPSRRVTFAPLSTISTGYDSPACAVLVRRAGCSEAFTFARARAGYEDRDDSGRRIGEALGLRVTEVDVEATMASRNSDTELEFIASGFGGDDVPLTAAEYMLCGRLLVTGTHGDKIWDVKPLAGGDAILRGDPSGSSMSEFRLRVGFVVFPVPFVGATRYSSVVEISNSGAMKPWSLGRPAYNRPIPRRLVEERGVPREWFGQSKKAITTPHHGTGRDVLPLQDVYTGTTIARFRGFLSARGGASVTVGLAHALLHVALGSYRLTRWLGALFAAPRQRRTFRYLQWRYSQPLSDEAWLFHWAVSELRSRYPSPEPDFAPTRKQDRTAASRLSGD